MQYTYSEDREGLLGLFNFLIFLEFFWYTKLKNKNGVKFIIQIKYHIVSLIFLRNTAKYGNYVCVILDFKVPKRRSKGLLSPMFDNMAREIKKHLRSSKM